jgi:Xaa-Pro dipeptidase
MSSVSASEAFAASASQALASAAGAKPWFNWPHELPTMAEARATPEFARLRDQKRVRDMHSAIRARTIASAKAQLKPQNPELTSLIIVKGGTSHDFELYDSDVSKCDFRQEAFFMYLFGLNEPDCYGALDLRTGESLLFVPRTSDEAERWEGTRRPVTYYTERYGVAQTFHTDELLATLKTRGTKQLFTLYGRNSDSGNFTRTVPDFEGIEAFANDNTQLYPLLCELRAFKTPEEVEVLRLGNFLSSQAHVYVMRHIKAGMSEIQLEALYKSWCAFHGGTRHCAYTVSHKALHGSERKRTRKRAAC